MDPERNWRHRGPALAVADRESGMLLVGAANVYPAEIEAARTGHPEVLDVCVAGIPRADLGQVPHAIAYVRAAVTDEELRHHLAARLPA